MSSSQRTGSLGSRAGAVTAWALAGGVLAAYVAVVVLSVQAPVESSAASALDMLWLASWLGFPIVGAAIVTRRPGSPLAWMLLGVGVSLMGGILASTLLLHQVVVADVQPAPALVWLSAWSFVPGFVLAPFVVDRFPHDRPVTGRWRIWLRVAATVAVVDVVAHAVRPEVVLSDVDPDIVLSNPGYHEGLGAVPETVIAAAGVALVVVFLTVIVRSVVLYRRSEGLERAQRKWFAAALCVFPLGFAVVLATGERLPDWAVGAGVAATFFLTLNGLAAAILIAVTRYRLFEVDRLVSRTVSYVALTLSLVGVYGIGVLGIGSLVPEGSSDLVVAGSTLVVAALFQPVRHRVQSVVDRRFNRARYDADQAVTAFGGRLRDEVDLDALHTEFLAVVDRTVQPAGSWLWLPAPARS